MPINEAPDREPTAGSRASRPAARNSPARRLLARFELTQREQILIMLILATLLIGGIVQKCRHASLTTTTEVPLP